MTTTPFTIDVPDSVLADLKERLSRSRWPEPIPGVGWDYGADPAYIRELCAYWRDEYNWRKQEAGLNAFPQYLAKVDGVDFHFWHVKGKGPSTFPLILVHGWPGSIYEFHHLIGPLTDPAAHGGDASDSFDVVIPALPGYGWSGTPQERGWGPTRTAKAFNSLMVDELGYSRYGTQGGDWGGLITSTMAANYGDHVAAAHLNLVFGLPPRGDESEEAKAFREKRARHQADETGYYLTQGTKPMSLAIAQVNSPEGIAAWIVEKFRTWSDCNGDVESVYTKDQLLTNIMFYWAPNSIASAANMYYEFLRDLAALSWSPTIQVPVGGAIFPKEIFTPLRSWCEPRMNITRWTEFDRGGHFAAMERPDEMLADIRAFFREIR